jgi:hypothetical protein
MFIDETHAVFALFICLSGFKHLFGATLVVAYFGQQWLLANFWMKIQLPHFVVFLVACYIFAPKKILC